MNENVFRVLAGMILVTAIAISSYFRLQADKVSGEKLSREEDGQTLMRIIRYGGLVLWLSPFVYLINPKWMVWSKIGLPVEGRWFGAAMGIVCVAGIYWLFRSIGTGITPVSATRTDHQLVTNGIYRWVRHPLYTIGSSLFVSFGMLADNWFIMLLGVLAFVVMAIRTPQEEAKLIQKFGNAYREYMKRTGRFLPKF
jgi:protein-S-isoprenylcysteine O-methyltransferase Ste14